MEIQEDRSLAKGVHDGILVSARDQLVPEDIIEDIHYRLHQGRDKEVEPLNSHKYFQVRRQYLTYRMVSYVGSALRSVVGFNQHLPAIFQITRLSEPFDVDRMKRYLEEQSTLMLASAVESRMRDIDTFEGPTLRVGQLLRSCAFFLELHKLEEEAAYLLGKQMSVIWDLCYSSWEDRTHTFRMLCAMTDRTPTPFNPIYDTTEVFV